MARFLKEAGGREWLGTASSIFWQMFSAPEKMPGSSFMRRYRPGAGTFPSGCIVIRVLEGRAKARDLAFPSEPLSKPRSAASTTRLWDR